MRGLLWLGLISLAGSWLELSGFFGQLKHAGELFLFLGVLFNLLAFRHTRLGRLDSKLFMLGLPLLVAILWLPFPYRLGPGMLLLSLGLLWVSARIGLGAPLFLGVAWSGLILLLQGLALPLYAVLGSRFHEVPGISWLPYRLLHLLGMEVALTGNTIYTPTLKEVVAFTTTWERLGGLFLLLFLVGALPHLSFLTLSRTRAWGRFLGSVAIFVGIRYVGIILAFLELETAKLFWHPTITTLTFLPMALLLARWVPLREARLEFLAPQPGPWFRRREVWTGLVGALTAGTLAGAIGFQDPGIRKSGRILINERYSDWEWTTEKLDTTWYGQRTTYAYSDLARFLGYHYRVERNFKPLTPGRLKEFDILILKVPTEPLPPAEIEAVVRFVAAGGGLFLIGEHTNVFGHAAYLNPLAERFGLRFRYDSTYDLPTDWQSAWKPPPLLSHPAGQHVPYYDFATSCTLEAGLTVGHVMIGYQMKSRWLNYANANFFPDLGPADYQFGVFLQAASVRYQQGRVLAFTDSTTFSNFSVFEPGKTEFLLGTMEWLNRKNRWDHVNSLLLIVSLASLTGTVLLWRSVDHGRAALILLSLCLLVVPPGLRWLSAATRKAYPLPRPHTAFTRVGFEREHSVYFFPGGSAYLGSEPDNFNTFFVWTQRLGMVPRLANSLEEGLETGKILVLINPQKPFSTQERNRLRQAMKAGKGILILAASADPQGAANHLLQEFGLRLVATEPRFMQILNQEGLPVGGLEVRGVVEGGTSLLRLEDGRTFMAMRKEGKGGLAAVIGHHFFNNAVMGSVDTVPTVYQRLLYEMEFWLLRGLDAGEFEPFVLKPEEVRVRELGMKPPR
ncbi:MAG: hypothetical protein HYY20_04660 [Candidatus Tectomicrobia bacterium]|uniref:DUF4350 domain-containing protein n=1 Tax=Tectimicrobiota bacterium TaxID=2528274 RepID=A0A932CN40_UNCTE|nr:hypothetical protein [Candidatus Tectomicrobia bacterium]